MKKQGLFLFLSILVLLPACKKNDEEKQIRCSLTQYGVNAKFPGVYSQTIIYSEENLFMRLNYSLQNVLINGRDTTVKTLIGTDSIVYDGDFVSRIYYKAANGNVNKYYEYENNGAQLISRREFDSGANFQSYNKEYLEYSNGHISHILFVKYYTANLTNPVDTIHTWFSFNGSGNLTKSITVHEFMQGTDFISDSIIKEYKVYDTKKNPFYGWPFPEMQDKCLSKNNFVKNKYTHKRGGFIVEMGTTELSYEYDENDFPLIGEYACEQK